MQPSWSIDFIVTARIAVLCVSVNLLLFFLKSESIRTVRRNWFDVLFVRKQVTPAQVREAEKNLKLMEGMIEAMTPGLLF